MIPRFVITVLLCFLLPACNTNTGSSNDPVKVPVESGDCNAVIHDFIYPGMLNIDSIPHICSNRIATGKVSNFKELFYKAGTKENEPDTETGSSFSALPNGRELVNISFTRLKKGGDPVKFALTSRFYDNDFAIFSYGAKTKILYDNRNNVILCFKREADYPGYRYESVTRIYLLDNGLMPVYSVDKNENSIVGHKYFYDDKYPELYSRLYDMSGRNVLFNQLKYNDIIQLFSAFSSQKIPLTSNTETHLSPYFKNVPLWTEN